VALTSGFLLTRHWRDTPTGVCLDLWFVSEQGPVHISIPNQKVIFFIRTADSDSVATLLQKIGAISIKPLDLQSFRFESMSGVYFDSQQKLYRARDLLKKNNLSCYESDIRPADRYLMERFITAPVSIEFDDHQYMIEPARLKPARYTPTFEVMSFDIETDYATNALFSIAFVSNHSRKVLMIGDRENTNLVEYVVDEKKLITRWIEYVTDIDPDIFIGWNVVNFDFRVLQQRSQKSGIALTIGRSKTIPSWRKAQTETDHHFISIPGRVVLCGIDTLKSATYNFPSFSLESVGRALLGRGKLIHDSQSLYDPLFKAKEIRRQFHEDKPQLAAYNLEDCQLVRDIFDKADLINFAIERARLTGLEMDKVGGSVAAFDNLYLPRLHRKGFVAPNIGDYQGELSAPGGYVMDSKPGMHQSVLVLDYKSLYPSIIRTFKVDPYARIAAKKLKSNDTIDGFDGASFSKHDNILPDIIATLWQARDVAKRDKNAALSQAIKIIMNSFYGVLGTPGCRVHDSRLTSSITKRSHAIILQTVKLIEAEGYDVIYGDTDSVFVSLQKACDNQQATEIGMQLVVLVNQYWQQTLEQEHDLPSYLEMEFETHFNQFFMPTVRGSDQGSKKRYAGLIDDEKGNRIIHYKGLETVRTDWTDLAKVFQQKLYQLVFDGERYEDYILLTIDLLLKGEYDDQLKYRKRLRKPLIDYIKNIPPHAQAAIKAELLFKKMDQPSRYRNKSWIEYVITLSGAETLECQKSKLDYEHYIERQLAPIADTILTAVDSSMDAVIGQQQNLF
jgi:DNA polymerase-2